MPLHDLLEDAFASCFNHIPVTWDYSIEIPAVNLYHGAIECLPIGRANSIPNKSPLAHRAALRIIQLAEYLRQDSGGGVHATAAELLG